MQCASDGLVNSYEITGLRSQCTNAHRLYNNNYKYAHLIHIIHTSSQLALVAHRRGR